MKVCLCGEADIHAAELPATPRIFDDSVVIEARVHRLERPTVQRACWLDAAPRVAERVERDMQVVEDEVVAEDAVIVEVLGPAVCRSGAIPGAGDDIAFDQQAPASSALLAFARLAHGASRLPAALSSPFGARKYSAAGAGKAAAMRSATGPHA